MFDYLLDRAASGGLFFVETVFPFWACWQICDWGLGKLKVRLRKPWILESKTSSTGPT